MRTRAFSFLDPQLLEQMVQDIEEQCLRTDTLSPLFHGATDWHSAVHGHWAILWVSHRLGWMARKEIWMRRLCAPSFAEELAHLARDPDFERPYGRAWFLRLGALCHTLAGGGFREAVAPVATDLLHDLLTRADPNIGEYQNPCWVALQLHHWFSTVGDEAGIAACKEWVRSRRPKMDAMPELDIDSGAFFSVWAVQSLCLLRILGGPAFLEHHHQQDVEPIHPIATLKAPVHHLGIHSSRAWGCVAAFEATRDRQWEASFIQHMAAASALHPVWRHNCYAYTHWVPQFLVYALAEWDVATSSSRF